MLRLARGLRGSLSDGVTHVSRGFFDCGDGAINSELSLCEVICTEIYCNVLKYDLPWILLNTVCLLRVVEL